MKQKRIVQFAIDMPKGVTEEQLKEYIKFQLEIGSLHESNPLYKGDFDQLNPILISV